MYNCYVIERTEWWSKTRFDICGKYQAGSVIIIGIASCLHTIDIIWENRIKRTLYDMRLQITHIYAYQFAISIN